MKNKIILSIASFVIVITLLSLYFINKETETVKDINSIIAETVLEKSEISLEDHDHLIPEIISSSSSEHIKDKDTLAITSSIFPNLKTYTDSKYLHVESDGMAKHPMMTGITSWQQQFPIPQDYTGTNSWSIPLFPALSTNPVSTKNNLYRGAIALAANGVPIFNALNNRGDDAYLAGELDEHGGHSGKGDDYHYHTAPMFLEDSLAKGMPIAYALDGYKVYGNTEPDGKMFTGKLDECNGHTYSDGIYHYHGVKTYPYMIGCMKGDVTVKQEQIDPQPKASPFRPAGEPLRGATITNFKTLDKNSYSLEYTLNSKKYIINYKSVNGSYVFEYVNPDGTKKTETYTIKK